LKTPIEKLEKMKTSVDHLPYSNMVYRIALNLSDSPVKPCLNLNIGSELFVKDTMNMYFRLFKEKYQEVYRDYRKQRREKK